MVDIVRDGWLLMIFYNGVMKGVSLLFVQYSNIISSQHNIYDAIFQNQALIGRKEVQSVLAFFLPNTYLELAR